jgi:3-hydroxyacyl-[acyl-carrier-protein] dehydratase
VPGDQMRIEMTLVRGKMTVVKMKGEVRVDGALVAEATVMCKLVEPAIAAAVEEVAQPQLA